MVVLNRLPFQLVDPCPEVVSWAASDGELVVDPQVF